MEPIGERMMKAQTLLMSYAVPITGGKGRVHPEEEDTLRFPFARDRDRIIHATAFRRLKGKTQVFVATEGDHFRTRLTHTMETAQIARDIARALALNEDLAECIALAHDLGHPPFGHAGEGALHRWAQVHDLGFEHNIQSHRIVTVLEEHCSAWPGLNLQREVLEGIFKHETPWDRPSQGERPSPSLEAQVVNLADEIGYSGHDCDDGLRAGLFTLEELTAVPLAAAARERAQQRGTSVRGALIHILVTDLCTATEAAIRAQGIAAMQDIVHASSPIVRFSPPIQSALDTLRAFLWQRMYLHPRVQKPARAGQQIVRTLCARFTSIPTEKIIALQRRTGGTLHEAVIDYVAGMTDEYARTLTS